MEIKLPADLEALMLEELTFRPDLDKKHYILRAILQQINRDKASRKNAATHD